MEKKRRETHAKTNKKDTWLQGWDWGSLINTRTSPSHFNKHRKCTNINYTPYTNPNNLRSARMLQMRINKCPAMVTSFYCWTSRPGFASPPSLSDHHHHDHPSTTLQSFCDAAHWLGLHSCGFSVWRGESSNLLRRSVRNKHPFFPFTHTHIHKNTCVQICTPLYRSGWHDSSGSSFVWIYLVRIWASDLVYKPFLLFIMSFFLIHTSQEI